MAKAVTTKKTSHAVKMENQHSALPDYMRGDSGLGTESLTSDDLEVPRVKLMQGLSKELEEYNDLRAGQFFHTASDISIGTEFIAVPVFLDRRYILWRPLENGGGILARADDGVHWTPPNAEFEVKLDKKDGGTTVKWRTAPTVAASRLAEWGTMNPADPSSQPAATKMYNVVVVFPDQPDLMPAVLTFQRSSIRMGRKLNLKFKTFGGPLFGRQYKFSSFKDTNSVGQEFFNINTQAVGFVTPEFYETAKGYFESFRAAGLAIKDLESAQDDGAGVNENDDAGSGGKPAY